MEFQTLRSCLLSLFFLLQEVLVSGCFGGLEVESMQSDPKCICTNHGCNNSIFS